MDAEKRIVEVFEMITDDGLEAMLDFRHNTPQTFSLEQAQAILEGAAQGCLMCNLQESATSTASTTQS